MERVMRRNRGEMERVMVGHGMLEYPDEGEMERVMGEEWNP